MSDDFIRGLQNDLVEAMERYERGSRRHRLATALQPRFLRPAAVMRAATVAALVAFAVVLALDFAPGRPPARPHVAAVLRMGGIPIDAAIANGSLWATDSTGSVVQVNPNEHRVIARMKVPGPPSAITTEAGALWVQTGPECRGGLLRVDPANRRIVRHMQLSYPTDRLGALAGARDGGVWVKRGFCSWRQEIDRIDPAGAVTARLALTNVDGLATAAGNLWALDHDGTLTQIDESSARIRQRWTRLAPLADPNTWNTKSLVADDDGVWALSTGRATILRIEHGQIVRRIALRATSLPILGQARDGLWTATGDRLGSDYRLVRIDPTTGRPTATLKLGTDQPVALTSTSGQLCVLTANGQIIFIRA